MVIETTELYILLPVWITLTFIQGHGSVRDQKLLHSLANVTDFFQIWFDARHD